jgi:tetratricopeptide (TPR) repeat protein
VALNKANTSLWVKILIIILIVAFVSLFMYTGIAGIFDLFKQTPAGQSASTVDNVTSLAQRYQPQVDGFKALAASNPTSYTVQVDLANAYYEWADALSRPESGQSQLTTAAMTAAYQTWTLAKDAYDKAAGLTKTFDPNMQTDRSYATFYSNDTTAAITIVKDVVKKDPKFAQGWMHLGIYYDNLGQGSLAIPAYQKYLALDPKGSNASLAADRLKALGASTTATKTP